MAMLALSSSSSCLSSLNSDDCSLCHQAQPYALVMLLLFLFCPPSSALEKKLPKMHGLSLGPHITPLEYELMSPTWFLCIMDQQSRTAED